MLYCHHEIVHRHPKSSTATTKSFSSSTKTTIAAVSSYPSPEPAANTPNREFCLMKQDRRRIAS
jgi:hypothetical protein